MAYSLNNLCRNVPQKQVQIEMIRDIVRNTFQLLFPNTGILRSTCKAAGATCKCKQHKHTLSHIFLLSYFFWCLVIIASILWVKFLKSQRSWCVNVGILFKCIPHLSVVRKLLKYKKKNICSLVSVIGHFELGRKFGVLTVCLHSTMNSFITKYLIPHDMTPAILFFLTETREDTGNL